MIKKQIEILTRAVIQNRGKFLICKNIKKEYYYFPGGHVEYGESSEGALKRELEEELGLTVKKCFFIGGSEHVFAENNKKHHEINLVFQVPAKIINAKSRESHIKFLLMDKNKMSKANILPVILKKAILKWIRDKRLFWISEI